MVTVILDPAFGERLEHDRVLVARQRYGEIVFGDELLVLRGRVPRYTEHVCAERVEIRLMRAEILCFASTPARIVLGVEIEHEDPADPVAQGGLRAVGQDDVEIRQRIA